MDLASILGLVLCFGMCIYGIISNAGAENFGRYIDPPSAIITFGGAFFAIMASTTLKELFTCVQDSCKRCEVHDQSDY